MSFSIFDERNFLGIIILLLSQEVVCHIHPFLQATMFSLSPFPEIQNQKISPTMTKAVSGVKNMENYCVAI
jgi:hypothetical protein